MLSIVPKFRHLLLDHIEQAQPDELAVIVEKLLGETEAPVRDAAVVSLPRAALARMPFAGRAIKLGQDGRPLERGDEQHVAVYDPLMDLTHPRADLADGELQHPAAQARAQDLRLFGLDGWALAPTLFDLESILDRRRSEPAADTSLLDVKSGWYWTDEVYAPDQAYRWCVYLGDGATYVLHHSYTAFARAVRAGQPFVTRS